MGDDYYKPKDPQPVSHPSGHLYTQGQGPSYDKTKVPQSKSGKGCFFYGCLTLIVLSIVGTAVTYFTAKHFFNEFVEGYTDENPMLIPKVEAEQAEIDAASKRFSDFVESVQTGGDIKELRLNSRDLNLLLQSNPDWQSIEGNVYFELDGEEVKGKVSIPLDEMGLENRYLNGQGSFRAILGNGLFVVNIAELTINGNKVPEEFMQEIRQENLAGNIQEDPEALEIIEKLESIQVIDSELVVTAK